MIDHETMRNLQHLSKLKLEPDEERDLASQLENILDYFKLLAPYEMIDTDPKTAIAPESLRPDKAAATFGRETLESLAVRFEDGHFIVPRILENEDG